MRWSRSDRRSHPPGGESDDDDTEVGCEDRREERELVVVDRDSAQSLESVHG